MAESDLLSIDPQRLDIHAGVETEQEFASRIGRRLQPHVNVYSQKLAGFDDHVAGDVLQVGAGETGERTVDIRPVLANSQIVRGGNRDADKTCGADADERCARCEPDGFGSSVQARVEHGGEDEQTGRNGQCGETLYHGRTVEEHRHHVGRHQVRTEAEQRHQVQGCDRCGPAEQSREGKRGDGDNEAVSQHDRQQDDQHAPHRQRHGDIDE